jgi:hypothetical protein
LYLRHSCIRPEKKIKTLIALNARANTAFRQMALNFRKSLLSGALAENNIGDQEIRYQYANKRPLVTDFVITITFQTPKLDPWAIYSERTFAPASCGPQGLGNRSKTAILTRRLGWLRGCLGLPLLGRHSPSDLPLLGRHSPSEW